MKKILLPAFMLIGTVMNAQCSELFFSEYLEGTSNNKAIEIYNPTTSPINLTDYVIYRYNNGSPTPSDSLFPQDVLAAGDVWVAGNPSAVAAILAESDTLHTITFFNGDDAMSIKKISTDSVLDIIGIIGIDPGTNWPVGTGATSEFTLVRMNSVQQGNLSWAVAATEYDVHPQNTFSFIGNHTMTSCCTPATVFLQSFTSNPCFGDSLGTIAVSGQGDGPYTYSWVNRPDTTFSLSGLPAGTYSAIVTGACGSDTMPITITEPPVLYDSLVDYLDPYCNTSNGMLQITGVGGTYPYSYVWNNGDLDDSISGVPIGTYWAVITDASGCTDTSQWQFIDPPSPVASISSFVEPGCNLSNGSITASATGGNPSYTYLWSNGDTTATIANLPSGVYTVFVTDSFNCADTVQYQLNNPPAPVVTLSLPNDSVCRYFVLTLTGASPAGGVWSGIGVTDSTFDANVPPVNFYQITYTYTDSMNCVGTAIDSIWVDYCVGINEATDHSVSIAPNPFTDEFRITFGTAAFRSIEIINVHGETVKAFTSNDAQSRVDMNDVAEGMYVIRIFDGNGYQAARIQKLN